MNLPPKNESRTRLKKNGQAYSKYEQPTEADRPIPLAYPFLKTRLRHGPHQRVAQVTIPC
jgi:hypothetical protein